MAVRDLPSDLVAALAHARGVEEAAVTRAQWLSAVHATTTLVRAARAEGWRYAELAPHLGLKVRTLRSRLQRQTGVGAVGIAITPPHRVTGTLRLRRRCRCASG